MNVYVISAYEIVDVCSESYFLSCALGAKIPSHALKRILIELKAQEKREITEKKLMDIALQYDVDMKELLQILISKLHILKPLLPRKIPTIYLNSDDELVEKLMGETLSTDYNVLCCPKDFLDFQAPSLVIYYRQNYSDPDFKKVHHALMDDVYLITCGVIHHQLVIDNIYFNHSGLPTHFSNLHDLMTSSEPEAFLSKNDSLSFYRGLFKRQIEIFPMLSLSPCQRGYIAYSIYQFLARFVNFDGQPTPHDAINWRWHVDLLTFGLQKEAVILGPCHQ
jgi:McbB family protein